MSIVAVGLCSLGLSASSPYMNVWTFVWVDCIWDFWDYEIEAGTTPYAPGPIYEVGVETAYAIGCGGWSCLGQDILDDIQYGDQTARVYRANNGGGFTNPSISGSASSDHWIETESFGDHTTSGDQAWAGGCNPDK
jgi:hypothetical protein